MYARSILWTVKQISECIDLLSEKSKLRGREVTVDQSNKARATLQELVEIMKTGSLRRPSNPADRRDQLLRSVLATMYERRSAERRAIADNLPGSDETLRSLKAHNQIAMKHGEVFVPLQGMGTARNWPPVLELLVHRFAALIKNGHSLIQKLQADGSNSTNTEFLLVQSLVERLESFRAVFRSHLSQLQLINYTVSADSHLQQFLTEIVPDHFAITTPTPEEIP